MSHIFLTPPIQQIRSDIPSGRSHEWNGTADRVMIIWNNTDVALTWVGSTRSWHWIWAAAKQRSKSRNDLDEDKLPNETHTALGVRNGHIISPVLRPIISRPGGSPSNPNPAPTITSSPVNHKLALIWCLLRAFLQVCDESSSIDFPSLWVTWLSVSSLSFFLSLFPSGIAEARYYVLMLCFCLPRNGQCCVPWCGDVV